MTTQIVRTPKLRHGDDAGRAAELRTYVAEAQKALYHILRAAFFVETIVADLPHGQIEPWLKAYCPDINMRTLRRWRQVAANLGEILGLSFEQRVRLKLPLHQLLALPASEVPPESRKLRDKIDAEIEGKTYRQLFLEFKNARETEDGLIACTGAGRFHPRKNAPALNAMNREETRKALLHDRIERLCREISILACDSELGLATDADFKLVDEARLLLNDYVSDLKSRRHQATTKHPKNTKPELPPARPVRNLQSPTCNPQFAISVP